jgi:uncharacterized membrane protein YsdA (DUF1294 family)
MALAWYLGAVNALAFVAFGVDKQRARLGRRRVRERTLHLLALAGGSVGSLLGMSMLRHKNRKTSFWIVLLGICVLQLAVLAWWALAGRAGAGR